MDTSLRWCDNFEAYECNISDVMPAQAGIHYS